MIDFHPIDFAAPVTTHDCEPYSYTVIDLPPDVVAALPPLAGPARHRVTGEVAGQPWAGAIQPGGGGRHYLLLSRRFLAAAGLAVGDVATVRLRLDDPETVDVPADLAEALDDAPDLCAVWDGLAPGARRGFVAFLAPAKGPETRAARIAAVLAARESDDPSPYASRRSASRL